MRNSFDRGSEVSVRASAAWLLGEGPPGQVSIAAARGHLSCARYRLFTASDRIPGRWSGSEEVQP